MRYRLRKLLIVLAVLLLYVASTGPMSWMYAHKRISPRAYYTYLAPLSLVGRLCPPVKAVTKWYAGWWSGQEALGILHVPFHDPRCAVVDGGSSQSALIGYRHTIL
jgi:hypothetical protein